MQIKIKLLILILKDYLLEIQELIMIGIITTMNMLLLPLCTITACFLSQHILKHVMRVIGRIFLTDCSGDYSNPSTVCKAATTTALAYIPTNIDLYDIYAPVCHTVIDETGKKFSSGPRRPIPSPREYLKWNPIVQRLYQIQKRTDDDFDECLDNYILQYLNQPDVQTALHVKSMNWKEIGNIIYSQTPLII